MRLMCVGSYYQHFYYFCKFWRQELIFKFCFKSLRKLPFKCSLAQVNQVQGPLELLSVIIQSTSSNTSRHQIFPECDTARHRWGKATGVGRIDHPCPQGVCGPAERRHKKTPTIIMQGAKCSAGGAGGEGWVSERMPGHRRISLPGPGNSPLMYKPGAESYLSSG